MIHSFSCENFYSFKDNATLSFVVNQNAPHNNGYFTAPSGTRLSKIEAVIGPNASGKTNLLKVLPFLKWIIVDSFNIDPESALPVRPFAFGPNKELPSELSATFEVNSDIYTYTFSLNNKRILSETLVVKKKAQQKTSTKTLLRRTWDSVSESYTFNSKDFTLPKDIELRSNASVISIGMRLGHKPSILIGKFWQQLETNVNEAGWVGDYLMPKNIQLLATMDFFAKNKQLKAEAEKILSRFDLGLEAFNITKSKDEDGTSFNVEVTHSFNGKKQLFPNLSYESSGTKQLFVVLRTVLKALSQGSVAVLDEFEVNLHPEIVQALFELFIKPETNPKCAQLLFSTHSHLILSRLSKYQIVLAEKNDDGGSETWRLDEMEGVRADDNYFAKYIAGAYGAIPKI